MTRSLPRKSFRPTPAPAEERAVGGETLWWPAPSLAGVPVTADTALSVSAVFACVNVLSTDLSFPALGVFQRKPDKSVNEVRQHDVDSLLRWSPDEKTTSIQWRQAWIAHALLWPGGYGEIQRRGNGKPYAIHLLDPSLTRAKDLGDRLVYDIEGGKRRVPGGDVLHIAGLGFDGVGGYSMVRVARDVFGLAMAAQVNAETYYGNGTNIDVVLKTAKRLSEDARKNLRNSWNEMHQGPMRAHRPAVLEEGLEIQQLSTDPEKAQSLQSRQFQVLEVCRLYRVPPPKVMDFSQAHQNNIEASNLDYLITSLVPWFEKIEQVMSWKLLTKAERNAGLFIQHDVMAFLRGDSKARGEFYRTLRELGAISPNEIRCRENMNPIGPEGDQYLVQGQYIPLDQVGKTPVAVPVSKPPAPTEPDADDAEPEEPDDGQD